MHIQKEIPHLAISGLIRIATLTESITHNSNTILLPPKFYTIILLTNNEIRIAAEIALASVSSET